ncbi:MAG: hypothetical protein EOM26_07710 [Alphaproteobacteria bacterium]|nr:hypothetical protein [Alphaproteobacteria bacterium]
MTGASLAAPTGLSGTHANSDGSAGRAFRSRLVQLIVMAGVLYNAALAVVNGHVTALSGMHVVAAEGLIAMAGLGLIVLNYRSLRNLRAAALFLFASLMLFLWVSFVNETIDPKFFRDFLLIVIFFLLGGLIEREHIVSTFRWLAVVTFGFLILEAFFTDMYADFFLPASYYENTRGIEPLGDDELFRNSLSFEGRITFGLFDMHRLSSLFLEPLSLANFALVTALLMVTFWKDLRWYDRILLALFIVMTIFGTNSRTAASLLPLFALGYFLFPLAPRFSNLAYMPLILAISILAFHDPSHTGILQEDNLKERIAHNAWFMTEMEFPALYGAQLDRWTTALDSGYAYVIFTQTIFGFLALWLFVSLAVPQNSKPGKRLAHGMTIFMFSGLVAGAAVFTIKVAAPLWLLAGWLSQHRLGEEADAPPERN